MKVAIIPARGGSKRIPRKNIREFCGKPMLAWSIDAALKSKLFDRIILSTDDPEICAIAQEHGAEVPFKRPEELASDHAGTIVVIRHALQWLEQNEYFVTQACCIYATSPFLDPKNLAKAHEMLIESELTDFVFPVTTFESPIFRAIKLGQNNETSMFWPEHEVTRSQDLPSAYHDAGQFYWGTRNAWLSKDSIFSARSCALTLPQHCVQDIDTEEDWIQAEIKFKALQKL